VKVKPDALLILGDTYSGLSVMPASHRGIRIFHGKFSCSGNQQVFELRYCLLAFRMNRKADRSALHVNDRLVPVPSIRRSGQTDNVSSFYLVQDPLKGNRGEMVAFVHNHLT
jgi:UDP-N-acetylglucosamine 2-epimerase